MPYKTLADDPCGKSYIEPKTQGPQGEISELNEEKKFRLDDYLPGDTGEQNTINNIKGE